MATKTEDEKKPGTGLANIDANKPSYLAVLEAQGKQKPADNFDDSDVSVPRIKLLQGTSKEIESFDNAKPGLFWHTGLDIPLGDSLKFVVCSRNKKYLLVAPLEDGQGILARADDFKTWNKTGKWNVKFKDSKKLETWEITALDVAESGLDKWGTSREDDVDSPPAATLFYDYLVLLPDHLDLGPAVLSLARSAIKPAKKGLNDKIKIHLDHGRPMQAVQFVAKTTAETNTDGQPYKGYRFESDGFATEEVYNIAIEYANSLTNFKIQDEEGAVGEGGGDQGGVAAKNGEASKENAF